MRFYLLFLISITVLLQACRHSPPNKKTPAQPKQIVGVKPARADWIKDTICIAAVGDIMLGTSYPDSSKLPPDSAKNSFRTVKAHLKNADIIFGNLEGTLLDTGGPANFKLHQKSVPFLFRMPANYAGVLKNAGFNVLSLANNHINDFGEPGIKSTTASLDSVGIYYAGLLRYPTKTFELNGVKYGFCAFSPNGQTVPLLNLKRAAHIIRNLKKRCDIVIVSFHGGGEGVKYEHIRCDTEMFVGENRGDVYAFAHNAIDAGADVIFGNGPHVNRAMEVYRNRLIAYSLGNFCTYKSVSVIGICGMAPLLKVNVNRKGEFLNGRIISFTQAHANGLVPDPYNGAANRIRMLTQQDFPGGGLHISGSGEITVGPAD